MNLRTKMERFAERNGLPMLYYRNYGYKDKHEDISIHYGEHVLNAEVADGVATKIIIFHSVPMTRDEYLTLNEAFKAFRKIMNEEI